MTDLGIENLTGSCRYNIDRGTLACAWLHDHIHDKNWVSRTEFDAAVAFARKHFGIKTGGDIL